MRLQQYMEPSLVKTMEKGHAWLVGLTLAFCLERFFAGYISLTSRNRDTGCGCALPSDYTLPLLNGNGPYSFFACIAYAVRFQAISMEQSPESRMGYDAAGWDFKRRDHDVFRRWPLLSVAISVAISGGIRFVSGVRETVVSCRPVFERLKLSAHADFFQRH